MNQEKLRTAIAEAERFLERATQLEPLGDAYYWEQPVLRGSVLRASMDLTRALADLRRPNP